MNKKTTLAIILAVAVVCLAVAGFILLPDTVITQVSAGGGSPTTMPKALAIALPTLIGLGGAAASAFSKGNESGRNKWLMISGVGILVFVLMLVVNL